MQKTIILSTLLLMVVSCIRPVYKAENYQETANRHRTIAVLPPKVIFEIKDSKNAAAIKTQEELESVRLQAAIVEYINTKHEEGYYFVTAMNAVETNKILAENGIASLTNRNYADLAKILGVDAVVSTRASLAQPLTNAEAFFTAMLTGWGSPSRISTFDLSITDKSTGKAFWNYNWQTGGTFTSSEKLTNSLMKSAAKKFPYNTQKNQ